MNSKKDEKSIRDLIQLTKKELNDLRFDNFLNESEIKEAFRLAKPWSELTKDEQDDCAQQQAEMEQAFIQDQKFLKLKKPFQTIMEATCAEPDSRLYTTAKELLEFLVKYESDPSSVTDHDWNRLNSVSFTEFEALLLALGKEEKPTETEAETNDKHSGDTRYERFIKWCKNNRLICFILIVIIIVIGLGQLTDALTKIRDAWFKPNSSTNQDVPVEISEISAFDEDGKTQLNARIRKRVNELYDEIYDKSLKPWIFNTGHDGSFYPGEGVRFEGSQRDFFWSDDFIPPIIENAIVKAFDQTIEECRKNNLDPKPYIYETNSFLAGFIGNIYNRMADIDRRLRAKRGEGPTSVGRKDVTSQMTQMHGCLKGHYDAAVLLVSKEN